MSNIEQNSNKKKRIKCRQKFLNKISNDEIQPKKKNNFIRHESHEIPSNDFSPIKISKTFKKGKNIFLSKNLNIDLSDSNTVIKEETENKNHSKNKKPILNTKRVQSNKIIKNNSSSKKITEEKNINYKNTVELKKMKIKSFYKVLNSIEPEIDSYNNEKELILTQRNNNEISIKKIINGIGNNKKFKISKKIEQRWNENLENLDNNENEKVSEILDNEVLITEEQEEMHNIPITDRNIPRMINFTNMSKNPFFNDNNFNKLQKNKSKKNDSIIKTSIGTILNSSTNESYKNTNELSYSNKAIPFAFSENLKNDSKIKINENELYDNFLNLSRNPDLDKFTEIYNKILKLPKESININYQDKKGYTALHYSCEQGNKKIVELLLKGKSDVNIKTKENKTPLHLSTIKGNFDICKTLIENKAEINVYDSENNSPLHYACIYNQLKILKYLLEKRVDIESKNINGKKPIDLTQNEEIKSLLKEYSQKNSTKKTIHEDKDKIIESNFKKKYSGIPKICINDEKLSSLKEKFKKLKIENKLIERKNSKTYRESTSSKKNVSDFYSSNQANKTKNHSIESKKNKIINQSYTTNYNNFKNNLTSQIEDLSQIEIQSKKKRVEYLSKSTNNNFNSNSDFNSNQKNKRRKNIISNNNLSGNYLSEEETINNQNNLTYLSKKKNINSSKAVKFEINSNNKSKDKDRKNLVKSKEKFEISDIINKRKSKEKLLNNNSNKSSNKCNSNKKINQKSKVKQNINYDKEDLNDIKSFSTKGLPFLLKKDNNSKNKLIQNKINNITKSNKILKSIAEEKINLSSFISLAILGRGSFGEVYLVQKKDTKKKYAMKVLNKDKIMFQNLLKYVKAERNVLSITNHPFIVKLYFAFQTINKLFLILEYCPGGDLAKHLFFEKKFFEQRAKFYICEVLLALEDLHKRNIIFRDLKPDNVVLDEEGHCKLTDFGLSKEGVYESQGAQSFCGSIAYLAPEMLKKNGHGKAVDWYLLGVLLYEMLVGVTPYFSNNKEQIFFNIENEELRIPQFVSEDAANLLRKLLERNPEKRIGSSNLDAEEIKRHPYFKDVNWDDIYNKKIKAPFKNNYNGRVIHYFKKPKLFIEDDKDILETNFLDDWSFIDEAEM